MAVLWGAVTRLFEIIAPAFRRPATMRPFQITDEFYLEVGKLAVAWAQVEIPLEFITGVFFEFSGGTNRFAKRLPRALDHKIEFCRHCLGELPQLAPFREGMTIILDRIEELSDHRHRIVHGIVDNFTPVPAGVIIIRKLEYGNQEHRFTEHRTSFREIRELTQDIIALGAATNRAAKWLGDSFGIPPIGFD
jgi:hypothetical protein